MLRLNCGGAIGLPMDFMVFLSLAMARIIQRVEIGIGGADRFVPQVIPYVAQIHLIIGHVGARRMTQPVRRGLFDALRLDSKSAPRARIRVAALKASLMMA